MAPVWDKPCTSAVTAMLAGGPKVDVTATTLGTAAGGVTGAERELKIYMLYTIKGTIYVT